jgi:hypothetical protein
MMSDRYIDIVPGDKCIDVKDMRHLIVFRPSVGAYCQGRELTKNERALADQIASLRARVAELEAVVGEAHVAMVKIGNDLNWDAPADEQLADAINSCRYALDAANTAPEEVTHG